MSWHGWAPVARLSYAAYLFTFLPVWIILPVFIERRGERLDSEGARVQAIFVASYISISVCLFMIALVLVVAFDRPLKSAFHIFTKGDHREGDGQGHRRRSTWDMVQRQFGNYF